MDLCELGWHQEQFGYDIENSDDLIPARVIQFSGRHYTVMTTNGELKAVLSNSFFNDIQKASDIPSVGDWVGLSKVSEIDLYSITKCYPRKNKLSRKVAGKKSEEQIIASNIDAVFIVTSADSDYNIRRLERYLSMVYEIKADPVIILNKIDKDSEFNKYVLEMRQSYKTVPIVPVSAKKGKHLDRLSQYFTKGQTIILVGSSGVGKSTLINSILGYPRQKVGETRDADDKGRHITTTRELIFIPNSGIIIDNPGIRELQLWSSGEGISKLFRDIEELSKSCRFRDCSHEHEPGCAVKRAVKQGILSTDRLDSYKKLLRENDYISTRRNNYEKRKKDKKLGKMYRKVGDFKRYKGKK